MLTTPRRRGALGAGLILRLLFPLARAEVYPIGSRTLEPPKTWELGVRHVFFVYGKEDAPAGKDDAYVIFKELEYHTSDSDLMFDNYLGLEVSVVKYEDFLDHPTDFCCTEADVRIGKCSTKDHIRFGKTEPMTDGTVFKHQVLRASDGEVQTQVETVKETIAKTGVYVLVVSNCGLLDIPEAELRGTIIVRNPYGFLSGIDYFKLPFYMWTSLVYAVLCFFWWVSCLRFRSEIFAIQWCIGVVSGVGLLECICWFFHYTYLNKTGLRVLPLFAGALFFSVVKSIFSYMLLLVGTMGWGITKPNLSMGTRIRIGVCTFAYIALDLARLVAMTGKDSEQLEQLSGVIIFGVLLPLSVLNGVIVYWVFGSLGKSIQKLAETNQSEKLKHFQCLWRVILFAVLLEVIGQFCEVATLSRSIEVQWQTQWMFADGVSHVIFIVVLFCMMWLWRPHEETQRYAYSTQLDCEDQDAGVRQPRPATPPRGQASSSGSQVAPVAEVVGAAV